MVHLFSLTFLVNFVGINHKILSFGLGHGFITFILYNYVEVVLQVICSTRMPIKVGFQPYRHRHVEYPYSHKTYSVQVENMYIYTYNYTV